MAIEDEIKEIEDEIRRTPYNKASQHHKQVAGAIFITLNNMMPEERSRKRLQIVDDMKNDGQLVYCYDMSDLYERLSPVYKVMPG